MNNKLDEELLVSVIVPVWNDAARLRRCISALLRQTLEPARYDVIVVDNGSPDETLSVAQELALEAATGGCCKVTVLQETKPGSYNARAKGLQAARGRFVAFTDSDCIPADTWLERSLNRAKADPAVGVVAGRIDLFEEADPRSANRWQAAFDYEQLFSFDQRRNVARTVAVTANWVSPRNVIEAVGGFDTTTRSGGDWRLARAISQAGWKIVFSEDSVVRHPARSALSDLVAKRRRVVGGAWSQERRGARLPKLARRAIADWARKSWCALRNDDLVVSRRLRVLVVVTLLLAVVISEITRLSMGAEPLR